MASQMVVRRMKRELELLSGGSAPPGIAAWPREEGSRLDVLDAEISGASGTPYEGGLFRLEVHIPPEYPLKPPRVRFVTPIYHPNIDTQGRICLDTLTMPPKGAWKPSLNISTLLTTVQALMSSPNADDGLMVEITEEYRRNPALFHKKARDHTNKHASANSVPSETQPDNPEQHGEGVKQGSDNNLDSADVDEVTAVPDESLDDDNDRGSLPLSGRLKKKPRLL